MVTVPAGETKIIELSITNSYSSTLYYGAWYEILSASDPSKVFVGLYTEKDNSPSSGTLTSGSSTTLLVGISNIGTIDAIVNVGTVGSLTSSLGLSNNRILLSSGWTPVVAVEAVNAIINLASTTACDANTSGVCPTNSYTAADGTTKYHDYRYKGANVNNYVWFNNDMYRIIGVFDDYTHGVTDEYLVKLISANVINDFSWGIYSTTANISSGTYSSYKNDWTGTDTGVRANLNTLLNEYFYTKNNTSSTYGTCINWTFGGYTSNYYKTKDCSNIIGYGINSTSKSYIQEVKWHLKGKSSNAFSKQDFYTCERSGTTTITDCASGNSGGYDISTTDYIGLMYASDFLYASGYYSSADTTKANTGYPMNQNWLYKGLEWTITPKSDTNNNAFVVGANGILLQNPTVYGFSVRPTFYLKSSVYINGGDGSFDNPYILLSID